MSAPIPPSPTTPSSADPLAAIALLQGLKVETRENLAKRCSFRCIKSGEHILSPDDDNHDVFFILKGRLRVMNYSASGREVAYAVVDAGGHVGELSAIDREPRSAAVMAIEDSNLAVLGPDAFVELLSSEAQISFFLLKHLARIIRVSDVRITELSTVGAMQRVYRELLRLSTPAEALDGEMRTEDAERIILNLPTQETLAAHIGTTRETVARALAQLSKQGIAKRQGRTLSILNTEALEDQIDELG